MIDIFLGVLGLVLGIVALILNWGILGLMIILSIAIALSVVMIFKGLMKLE